MPNLRVEAAVRYAQRGWSVIPCYPETKRPRGEWKQYQEERRTEDEIRSHWDKYPDDNVGIVTGKISGISCVDVDGAKGEESLQTLPSLPETRTHVTPHGTHHIFEYEPQLYTAAGFLPGLDVRGDGGFIVAPPSILADGGEYQMGPRKDVESIGDPPEALKDRRSVPSVKDGLLRTLGDTPNWVSEALNNGAAEGQRNQTATKLAGYFFSLNTPADIIMGILQGFSNKCDPPMDTTELNTIIVSTERYHTIEEDHTNIRGSVYSWPEKGINVTVENLRRTIDGCKCVLRITREDGSSVLAPSGIDMLSVSSRASLIRALEERVDSINWGHVIETLSTRILERMETGEVIVDLKDYIDTDVPKWLLNPFILGDGATILFGPGGLGKSMITQAMMLTMETGLPIFPIPKRFKDDVPPVQRKGLYLDWEDSADAQGERFAMLLKGVGAKPHKYGLAYQACSSPLHDIISTLNEKVQALGIEYLVIDSAALACGGAPDSSDSALNFFNALKKLNLPSLIIAHQTKDSSRPYPFGSIFWHNSARCTWEIKSDSEAGADNMPILLINQKSNRGQKGGRLGVEVAFNERDGTIKLTPQSAADVEESFGGVGASNKERVYLKLREEGALTVASLADALDMPENSVRQVFSRDAKAIKQYFTKTGTAGREPLYGILQPD